MIDISRRASFWILITIVLIGSYLRLYGIAFWELTVDEYFLGKSIISVAENGLPNFPDGGYYLRGILQQYLTAPIYLVTDNIELSVRIIPALSNIIAIPGIFLIGSSLLNKKAGLLAAALFSLSLWEIEFARFGRMYAPFQALFIWQVCFLMRYYLSKKLHDLFIVSLISLTTVFVYEGAIFSLLTTFFAASLHSLSIRRLLVISPSLIGLGLAVFLKSLNLRNTETTTQPQVSAGSGGALPINIPEMIFLHPAFSTAHVLLIFVAIFVTLFLIKKSWNSIKINSTPLLVKTLLFLMIGALIINQLLMGTIILGALLLLSPKDPESKWALSESRVSILFIFGIWFITWAVIALLMPTIGPSGLIESTISFPELRKRIFWPMQNAIPITSAWIGLTAFLLAIYNLFTTKKYAIKISLVLTALLVLAIGSIDTLYSVSRYSFFVYPLFILFFAITLTEISSYKRINKLGNAAAILLMVSYIVSAEDYKLGHILNLSGATYNYRIPYKMELQEHYYVRFDFRSPAEYVNNHTSSGDRVLTTVRVVDHYINKVDFIYIPKHLRPGLLACGGNCYIWNKKPLISDQAEIKNLIKKAKNDLWLVIYLQRNIYRDSLDEYIQEQYPQNKVYENFDNSIAVYKF